MEFISKIYMQQCYQEVGYLPAIVDSPNNINVILSIMDRSMYERT